MPEVVDSHVVKGRVGADPPPRAFQIREMCALSVADDDPRIVVLARKVCEQTDCRRSKRYRPPFGLAVAQP